MFHATCISCGEDAISIEICNAKEYAQKLPERWGKIVRESAELVMETGGYFVQYKKNAGMKDMCLSADSIVGMLELLQVSCCCPSLPPPSYLLNCIHTRPHSRPHTHPLAHLLITASAQYFTRHNTGSTILTQGHNSSLRRGCRRR